MAASTQQPYLTLNLSGNAVEWHQGRAHNHAFVSTPVAVRVAKVEFARWGIVDRGWGLGRI